MLTFYVKRFYDQQAMAVRWACMPARVQNLKKATAAVCELRLRRVEKKSTPARRDAGFCMGRPVRL